MTAAGQTRLILFALSAALLTPLSVDAQPSQRTLTGTVTDGHREPLKGAIVQVEDEQTGRVASYLTEVDGSYRFKRLSSADDYKVWATYRGHKSRSREMSHFDSSQAKTIPLRIRLD